METKINKLEDNVLSVDAVIHLMLCGNNENNVIINDIDEVNSYNEDNNRIYYLNKGINLEDRHKIWFMPEFYKTIDVLDFCLKLCNNDDQIQRVCEEFILYEERNLIMLLRYFIYLVSVMRTNNIINGVGRGSSVSSYILFLIGIHRVDSIKYNLDISDFLK